MPSAISSVNVLQMSVLKPNNRTSTTSCALLLKAITYMAGEEPKTVFMWAPSANMCRWQQQDYAEDIANLQGKPNSTCMLCSQIYRVSRTQGKTFQNLSLHVN